MNKKIHILYDFSQSSGGGKSFLLNLRDTLQKNGLYSTSSEEADVILINSHNHLEKALGLKKKFAGKKAFLHRIDGPMRVYNHRFDERDLKVKFILENISDGAIFQSKWSYENHVRLYGKLTVPYHITHNAVNNDTFFPSKKLPHKKIKVIGSSWSHQINKGGDYYAYLDENLDTDKFEMCFVGNTSHKLKNIRCLGVMNHEALAKELRESDVFFFPSLYEACSNALLEGIASGLIPLVRAGSSNLEIVQDSRLQFSNYEEALSKLNAINIQEQYLFKNPSLSEVTASYSSFADGLIPSSLSKTTSFNHLSLISHKLIYKMGTLINRKFS